MSKLPVTYIFSAIQNTEDNKDEFNHKVVLNYLKTRGIQAKEVNQVFKVKDSYNTKRSIILVDDFERQENKVKFLCREYHQQSFLKVDELRNIFKVNLDGTPPKRLGKLKYCDSKTALENGSYIYCPTTNAYYVYNN